MMRLLFLQYIYDLSDVRVIEDAGYNLAYLWFLGLNPEDNLPDASLLAKFRTQRLKENTLDEVLTEIVSQCVNKGIIKGKGVSIDSTHMEANCIKKTPERLMKHLARRIFAGLKADMNEVPESVDTNIPEYEAITEHNEAKRVMKEYLEKVIEQSEAVGGEATKERTKEARDILSDEKFIPQKGIRSLSDKNARVGYKSKVNNFFGYKSEFMMTTDERIITAVDTHSGEYVDGTDFDESLERTLKSGMRVDELYGDKAYFKKDILKKLEAIGVSGYIPVSASSYHIDEARFSYNKDSDQWFCVMGNMTITKVRRTHWRNKARGEKQTVDIYKFNGDHCAICEKRSECMGSQKCKARILEVSPSTPLFYEYSQMQKSPDFLEKYKARSSIEWKNGEMKRFHGMKRARGFGITSVRAQVKLTAIAVNLKRIANILIEREQEVEKRKGKSRLQSFFIVVKAVFTRYRYKMMNPRIGLVFCGYLV
jgi:IS5 family transposase